MALELLNPYFETIAAEAREGTGVPPTAQPDNSPERRAEPRYKVRDAICLVRGTANQCTARVLDVSPSGLGLRSPQAFAVGELVDITLGDISAQCHVRYCNAGAGPAFDVGVQLVAMYTPKVNLSSQRLAGLDFSSRHGLSNQYGFD